MGVGGWLGSWERSKVEGEMGGVWCLKVSEMVVRILTGLIEAEI